MSDIATRLKCALGDTGFTQKELAQMTGLTEVSISRYVNGDREPKATTLARIADALGVGIGYFFDSVDKDTNVPSADCISRQAAIERIVSIRPSTPKQSDYSHGVDVGLAMAIVAITEQQSAQPQYKLDEFCTDCKEYDKERHSCPRWNRVIRQTVEDMKAAQPQWIPVTERLPEAPFGCIVTVWDTNPITMDEFENILPYFVGWDGEQWNDADGERCPFEVIAWMPLPEPYKEGKI